METTKECKHGLKQGCVYCHAHTMTTPAARPASKRRSPSRRLSEQMNDRMTTLKKRLKEIRGGERRSEQRGDAVARRRVRQAAHAGLPVVLEVRAPAGGRDHAGDRRGCEERL